MTDDTSPAAIHPAGRSAAAWGLLTALFVFGVLADLASKAAAFEWVGRTAPQTGSRPIIPGFLRFTLSTNPGVVFGFDRMPDAVVLLATVAAVAVVLFFFVTSEAKARWTHAALAMILAGAVGNMYDRIFSRVQLPGRPTVSIREVRDFIDLSDIHIGPLNYPWIFNIADVLLVVGVAILFIVSIAQWRTERAAHKKAAP